MAHLTLREMRLVGASVRISPNLRVHVHLCACLSIYWASRRADTDPSDTLFCEVK